MPHRLMARYIHERGRFSELNFAAMKETKPKLPDRQPADAA